MLILWKGGNKMTLKATPWWLEKKGENIYFLSCTIFWRKPCISRKMDWVFPCCCLTKHPAPSASCAGLCGCSSVTGFPSPATRSGSWPHCNHAGNQKKKDCSIFLWLASSLTSAPSKFMSHFLVYHFHVRRRTQTRKTQKCCWRLCCKN